MLTQIIGSLGNYYGHVVEEGPFIGNQDHYLQMIRGMPNIRRASIERVHNIFMENIEARHQDNLPGDGALEYAVQQLTHYMPKQNFAETPFTVQVREREGKRRLTFDYRGGAYQYNVTFNEQPLLYDRIKKAVNRKKKSLKKCLISIFLTG